MHRELSSFSYLCVCVSIIRTVCVRRHRTATVHCLPNPPPPHSREQDTHRETPSLPPSRTPLVGRARSPRPPPPHPSPPSHPHAVVNSPRSRKRRRRSTKLHLPRCQWHPGTTEREVAMGNLWEGMRRGAGGREEGDKDEAAIVGDRVQPTWTLPGRR